MKPLFLYVICFLLHASGFSQNVGIGTTNPVEKLHVAGNIKVDTAKPNALKLVTNAGVGKILTSDAAGNAIWQNNNSVAAGNVGFGVWGDCATNGNISDYQPVADATGAGVDRFGVSTSISGNYAFVGAYLDDIGANADQGSVSIYQYNGSSWVFMNKITDPTGEAGDQFGVSLSISGNYAVVGALGDNVGVNANQGSVTIYRYNGTNWVFMQQLIDPTGAAGDNFGFSVSISGNYIIVGASGDAIGSNASQGSASIFQYNGTSWVFMQQLIDATGSATDVFGYSVSISGNYAIVGAPLDDVGLNLEQGSASIYKYDGSTWVLMQKLTDATGAGDDLFGTSVSISGDYAIVGAASDNIGSNSAQGSASAYRYDGSSWVLMQKLTDANGGPGDNFGYSVSISGNYVIVGAYFDDVGSQLDQGSASIYLRMGLGWQKLQYVTDPGGNPNDYLGSAIAFDSITKQFLIGVYGYANNSGKVVFGKVN